jgi:hypothetical protein
MGKTICNKRRRWSESGMTVQNILDEIIKLIIAPMFKNEGFKKSRKHFYKQLDERFGWCFPSF